MIKPYNFKKGQQIYLVRQGYTLIEALIYLAVFIVVSSIIVSLIWSVTKTSRQVTPLNSISRGAVSSLEVITREIRGAASVDLVNRVFSTSTGILELVTVDNQGNLGKVKFYISSSTVKMDKDNIYLGPLSSNNVSADTLMFNYISSSTQNLIKIELGLSSGTGAYKKSEKFYSSVRLHVSN